MQAGATIALGGYDQHKITTTTPGNQGEYSQSSKPLTNPMGKTSQTGKNMFKAAGSNVLDSNAPK